jgi:hypothetical protein
MLFLFQNVLLSVHFAAIHVIFTNVIFIAGEAHMIELIDRHRAVLVVVVGVLERLRRPGEARARADHLERVNKRRPVALRHHVVQHGVYCRAYVNRYACVLTKK